MRLHAFPESLTLANNLVSLGLSLLLCLLELLPDVDRMWELHLEWGLGSGDHSRKWRLVLFPLDSILHHPVSAGCGHAVEQIFAILSSFFFFFNGPFFKSLLNFLQCCFVLFFFFGLVACEILPHQTETEPTPSALESEVLTTGPPGKSLLFLFESGDLCNDPGAVVLGMLKLCS